MLSPDGSTVVYKAGVLSGTLTVYSVPITGGPSIQLSTGQDVDEHLLSPDGTTVVIREDGGDFPDRLYSVPIGGGPRVFLNEPQPFSGSPSPVEMGPRSSIACRSAEERLRS